MPEIKLQLSQEQYDEAKTFFDVQEVMTFDEVMLTIFDFGLDDIEGLTNQLKSQRGRKKESIKNYLDDLKRQNSVKG